ncbi:hypothetical protein C7Y47_23130 [Lysinibacillus sphaericus]|uniref:Lipoprotein n=1 Tax=Lysinibacillus sphaericus TaxID=1421 RepID=A0A544U7S1_LYSSH|nr:hypothetical protein [Lysinibacillus sp. SDF0037]TQR27482.1 hypothetical protein C7Y47_23130 [Lysinibacillus sp. SDF0037]
MKKISLVILFLTFSFNSLLLVSCSEEKQSEKSFQFAGEIQKIVVVGKGVNRELGAHTVDKEAEINIIKNAMQNASITSKKHTDEGALFEIEVIFEDNSKKIVDLWYYPSEKVGRFYTDAMYALNSQAVPELIEFLESFE